MSARDLPTVLRDTREELPLSPFIWRVRHGVAERVMLPTRDVSLDTGDYSLPGVERLVIVERKSLADLWGTLFGSAPMNSVGEAQHAQDRFRRELHRMRGAARRWLLVEGSKGSLMAYARERYERNGSRGRGPEENVNSLLDILAAMQVDYGIAVEWAGGRVGAEAWLGRVMCRVWSQACGGEKARTVARRGLTRADLPWLDEASCAEPDDPVAMLAGAGGDAQDMAGAEEASDVDQAHDDVRRVRSGADNAGRELAERAYVRAAEQADRRVFPGVYGEGASSLGDRGGAAEAAPRPAATKGSAAAPGDGVAHDAGKQGAEAQADAGGDDARELHPDAVGGGATHPGSEVVPRCGEGRVHPPEATSDAHGASREGDGGRGRATPPEATASAVDGEAAHIADPSPMACAALLVPDAAVVLTAPSPPLPVCGGQERASLTGRRVRVKRLVTGRTPLWLVVGVADPGEAWHTAALIERDYPIVVDSAAPWVRPPVPPDARVSQILAGRDPLLGVAGTWSEHAAAAQRKRAGRPAKATRRGRARA